MTSIMPVPPLKLPKILLVDDRPANLLALEAVLGDVEYRLLRALSGREALAMLEQNPDTALVLLDVQMPDMDGFEVARRIKEHAEWREIPIIFITAIHTEDPFVRQGYAAGAVDYFSKPFDSEVLRLKVGIYATFRQRANFLKEKERQLRESEELLRTGRKLSGILETLPVGVVIADHAGRVCQTNDEVLRLLQSIDRTATDSYGDFLTWWEHDGHVLKREGGPLKRALTTGFDSHNEVIQLKCLDGTLKSMFTSASPLRGLDRRIVGAVVVLQDVTAQREIEADIKNRIVRLVSLGVEIEEATKPGG
ncbi:MAG TPA: response regulator [Opitutaceae bacterium]|nr:response regulator [Opitutaceae bacterium]